MSLQNAAITDLVAKADKLGVPVPDRVRDVICGNHTAGAVRYLILHPEYEADPELAPEGALWCCAGTGMYGDLARCTCWEPVYDIDQAPPGPVPTKDELRAQSRMCGDCAFRKDSPERADPYTEEKLLELPGLGQPFWCHSGMRRPIAYRHPIIGDIPADPADWNPPIVDGVPFQADGTPGLLCAGWNQRALRAQEATA